MGAKATKESSYSRGSSSNGSQSPNSSPRDFNDESSDTSIKMKEMRKSYTVIEDNYISVDHVTRALKESGFESSNLIVGIDFTKSNEWTGKESFDGKCLHHISENLNPYQHAISIIGRTLSTFDEDNLIPCFGFGDVTTHDKDVFSFYPDHRPCNGFEEALLRYKEIVPYIRLSGPTSYAPIIETSIGIVDESGGQYHVLLIIANGQVTRSGDTSPGKFSPQERSTIEAIVKASEYPLSIIVVGVGDGPWEMMHKFDDNIPARAFDNIQFVNFTEIMSRHVPHSRKENIFALDALMEIPVQYRATLELNLLGNQRGVPRKVPLCPPLNKSPSFNDSNLSSYFPSWRSSDHIMPTSCSPCPNPLSSSSYNKNCPVCFYNKRDLAFGCGHQTCSDCGNEHTWCPICRKEITTRLKLYD